jgi:hypothetical protein
LFGDRLVVKTPAVEMRRDDGRVSDAAIDQQPPCKQNGQAPAKTFQCRGYGECRAVFSRRESLARQIRCLPSPLLHSFLRAFYWILENIHLLPLFKAILLNSNNGLSAFVLKNSPAKPFNLTLQRTTQWLLSRLRLKVLRY